MLGAAAGLALAGIVSLIVWQRRRDDAADPEHATEGTLVVPAGFVPAGRVEVRGDIVVREAGRSGDPRRAEMDVPTQDVDRILSALRTAGFEVNDTGLTVDTDAGEETLTTIALSLDAMPASPRPFDPEDVLAATGDILVEAGVRIACSLEAGGTATLRDGCTVAGAVRAARAVHLGADCRIYGDVESGGDVHLGLRAQARAIRARRDVHLADVSSDTMGRLRARRVHIPQGHRPGR